MGARQRLVVCLDGTWNRQDSSTNVLHHFNLVHQGPAADGMVQRKYYHRGVGTGVLDSLTGGGFGFGVEANVRDAYTWLVANFSEYEENKTDEIFIFGFSRGAYEARSLVGFIAQCGLLRRGAPITVEQLWGEYCILGRRNENRKSLWEILLGAEKANQRPITTLERESKRGGELSAGEELLLSWSRRVNITYLGIYDTVGAIGWDALAIPGVTSRIALHNNLRPTTIIQKCRHALAIDENRSSFNHTPFIAYLEEDSDELARVKGRNERTIAENRKMWRDKIEQRWFVGAHSNVGGGYPDNRLAERPLQWILEGASVQGLESESLPQPPAVNPGIVRPRDSYHEFAAPLWDTVIRNKRNYRVVDPAAKLRARANGSGHGFALETINETVDAGVTNYWAKSGVAIPPNLECYLKREGEAQSSSLTPASHVWLKEALFPYASLVMWAILAVLGTYAIDRMGGLTAHGLPLWVAFVTALALPIIDWGESKVTFTYAVGKANAPARAFLDAVYWVRSFGFVLFVFGFVYGICLLLSSGWGGESPGFAILSNYWPVLILAAAPAIAITQFRSKPAWAALVVGPAILFVVAALLYGIGAGAHHLFPEAPYATQQRSAPELPSLAGLLLLLQLAGIYFFQSLLWCGEPLTTAHLGSITSLQKCWTPGRVMRCLNGWRDRLSNTEKPDESPNGAPAVNLRDILRQALWRDILGFIPVYTGFLLFGLWFATQVPYQDWSAAFAWIPSGVLRAASNILIGFWWVLPLITAATDYLEDACHLRYIRVYETTSDPKKIPAILPLFSCTMTLIKDVTFGLSGAIATLAVIAGTWAAIGELTDWRAKIAVVLTLVGFAFVALLAVAAIVGTIRKSQTRAQGIAKARAAGA